jgi:Ca2+-binding RTX toxin-like protein
VHAVILKKQRTAAPSVPREVTRDVERRTGLTKVLIVAIGILLLNVVTANALAASGHDDGTAALRGTEGPDRLADRDGENAIWGLGGGDELYGGGGRDLILGGEGDDFIEAKDGETDFVGCGPGTDVASVDTVDRVENNCETLYPG